MDPSTPVVDYLSFGSILMYYPQMDSFVEEQYE